MKSKSQKIRDAIAAGKTNKEIVEQFRAPISTVYTIRSKMKHAKPANKVGRPRKHVAPVRVSVATPVAAKPATPMSDFIREELANVERQIDNMQTIASFLTIRLRQLEQNGE